MNQDKQLDDQIDHMVSAYSKQSSMETFHQEKVWKSIENRLNKKMEVIHSKSKINKYVLKTGLIAAGFSIALSGLLYYRTVVIHRNGITAASIYLTPQIHKKSGQSQFLFQENNLKLRVDTRDFKGLNSDPILFSKI
jgi:hypothetical protein